MARRLGWLLGVLAGAGLLSAAGLWALGEDKDKNKDGPPVKELKVEYAPGKEAVLKYQDLKEGKGTEARKGDEVDVHYTGWLTSGKKFDSSHDHEGDKPFTFTIDKTSVIKGWHVGVAGMKEGGKRKLTIPPELAYGARGRPPVIPPNATLVFEIELLKVR